MPAGATLLLDGLVFPEAPPWHDGRLWLSDIRAYRVLAVDELGHADVIVELPDRPSRLGWPPDGRLVIVAIDRSCLLRLEDRTLVKHAELPAIGAGSWNDMVVDTQGRAYVGNTGYDPNAGLP